MATSITLRSVKGSALTHAEVDDNFSNLKATADAALPSATAATTYQPLDGDLTSIAGLSGTSGFLKKTAANTWSLDTSTYLDTTTAASTYQTQSGMSSYLTTSSASSTYQTLAGMTSYLLSSTATSTYVALAGSTMTGNLTFSGNSRKIIGDFNNATVANRLSFQTSTANAETVPYIIPNGTGNTAGIVAANASDPTNSSIIRMSVNGSTDVRLNSDKNGTGSYLPMTFYTGGTERVRIDSSGNVGIGTSAPVSKLDIVGTLRLTNTANAANYGLLSDLGGLYIQSLNSNPLYFATGGSERMRVDSSGNVGIGTSSPASKLTVTNSNTSYVDTIYAINTASGAGAQARLGLNVNGKYATLYLNEPDASLWLYNFANGPMVLGTNNAERMRIDSSGNVGIGLTGPKAPLEVYGAGQTTAALTDAGARGGMIRLATSGTAAGDGGAVLFANTQGDAANSVGFAAIKGLLSDGSSNTTGAIAFSTRTSPTDTALTERMRIDANGFATVTGSFGRGAPVTKTGNFTLAATENWIICNGTGSITVTLPAASSWTGRELTIKTVAAQTVVSASSNVVPLAGGSAGTAILAATAGKFATLVSDGTNWVIMAGN